MRMCAWALAVVLMILMGAGAQDAWALGALCAWFVLGLTFDWLRQQSGYWRNT